MSDDFTTAVRPEPAPPKRPPAPSPFDTNPAAIAWARAKIEHVIARAEFFERETAQANAVMSARWRLAVQVLRRDLLGGKGCPMAAFDERLIEMTKLTAAAETAHTSEES